MIYFLVPFLNKKRSFTFSPSSNFFFRLRQETVRPHLRCTPCTACSLRSAPLVSFAFQAIVHIIAILLVLSSLRICFIQLFEYLLDIYSLIYFLSLSYWLSVSSLLPLWLFKCYLLFLISITSHNTSPSALGLVQSKSRMQQNIRHNQGTALRTGTRGKVFLANETTSFHRARCGRDTNSPTFFLNAGLLATHTRVYYGFMNLCYAKPIVIVLV